jgi:FMN reductase (NADPH)
MSTDVLESLNSHVTIRDFTDDSLDEEILLKLLRAARRSPTSSNMQTYSLVVVRDQETKKKLSVIASNQQHIITCPVFVAICADVSRLKLACEMRGEAYRGNLERTNIAIVDAALVGMSLSLAAESLGLGTVMIGAMRNDPVEAAHLLGLPDGAFVVYGLCIGWPAERPPQKPRLPEDLIVHYEQYNTDKKQTLALLEEHDKALAEHYRSIGRETPDAAWTGTAARMASNLRREFLRDVLEKLGLDLT